METGRHGVCAGRSALAGDLSAQFALSQLHMNRVANAGRRGRAQDVAGRIAGDAVAPGEHRLGRQVLEVGGESGDAMPVRVKPAAGGSSQPVAELIDLLL